MSPRTQKEIHSSFFPFKSSFDLAGSEMDIFKAVVWHAQQYNSVSGIQCVVLTTHSNSSVKCCSRNAEAWMIQGTQVLFGVNWPFFSPMNFLFLFLSILQH